MFKNCRKEDLRIVALELGETVAEKVTLVELTEIIKENKYCKENVELVKELIQHTIEDRKKAEEDRKKEAENRLREKELELEIARLHVGVNSDNERTGEVCNSLDALVKSVRILTVKVPNRPEERKTVNRDLVVLSVKRGIIKRFIIQSERETRKFIDNCRSKVKKRGPLTTSEVNDAETWLIKQDQSDINLSDPSEMRKTVKINDYDFDALIDTESTITLIPESVYQILGRPTLNPTKIKLLSFGKSEIKPFGSFKSTIDIENKFMTDIYVVDNSETTIDIIIGTDVLKQTEFKISANGIKLIP
ncbi:hypothetical protein TNIN_19181 [Trichonephila inaurata madagascariensis]|uniref:Peptidase A2 domain-containing protein n=1 Tax=Trichonephila inaurata madagascariensis TaxID=2747483 RepID=A0A8X6WSL4_9ARAC|nr:hypothetical protein TNIN_19181 [Trichonephila inaurata madagascariensis]